MAQLGAMLGPCWRHFGGMLGYFAVSGGAVRDGPKLQKHMPSGCNLLAILEPRWADLGGMLGYFAVSCGVRCRFVLR